METTQKTPEQTIGEIQQLLKKVGVRGVFTEYNENCEIIGLKFVLDINNHQIPFKIPINHKPLWELAQDGKTKYIKTEEQSRKVAWRQIFRWLEAQIAIITIGMVTPDEVFLPYVLVNEKQTLFEKYQNAYSLLEDQRKKQL